MVIARVWCMATSGARSVPGPHSLYPLLMVTPCDQAAVTRGWRHKRGEMSRHAVYQDLSPVESRALSSVGIKTAKLQY